MHSSDASAQVGANVSSDASTGSTPSSKKKRILAALLSAIVPGTGHLLRRDHLRAAIYLPAYVGVLVGVYLSRAFSTYIGCIGSIWIIEILVVAASISALLSPRRSTADLGRRFKMWAFPATIVAMLFASLAVNLCLRFSGFRLFSVPSVSMEPAIRPGSRLIADERYYTHRLPSRGDVICYRTGSNYSMKRVIALAGDSIEGADGRILVNGTIVEEPYAVSGSAVDGPAMRTFSKRTVPPGKLFVMGDNRDFSYDSRLPEHGDVNVSAVTGRALYSFSLNGENTTLTLSQAGSNHKLN